MEACPAYDKWIGDSHASYQDALGTQVEKYAAGLAKNFDQNSGGVDFLESLLDESEKQWNAISRFIDKFYQKLVSVAKFSADRAWKLVARCILAIFETIQPYRASVALLEDLTIPENKAAMIWAKLQCHCVIKEFQAVDFKSHPAIVCEISLFISTKRVYPEEIKRLSRQVEALEKEKKVWERLQNNFNELKRSHDNLQNSFNQHKEDVKKLRKQ